MLASVCAEVSGVAVLRLVPPARLGKLCAALSRLPANDAGGTDTNKFASDTKVSGTRRIYMQVSAGSIYRSITTLVNVRYRYFTISRYFDIYRVSNHHTILDDVSYRSDAELYRTIRYIKNRRYRCIARNLDIVIPR